jgi:ribose transport system substrate-binding protein
MRFRQVSLALCCVGALAITACGSDSDSTTGSTGSTDSTASTTAGAATASAGLAEAKKTLAAASAPKDFELPGEPFDASKAKGKTVYYVMNQLTTPFNQNVEKGVKEAFDAVGAKVIFLDGQGTVSAQAKGIESGVGAKADLIVLHGIDPKLVEGQVASAKKAGIPVAAFLSWSPGMRPDDLPEGIVAGGGHSYQQAGTWMGSWVTARADDKPSESVFITASDAGAASAQVEDGFKSEVKATCPDCTVKTIDSRVADWSKLGNLVSTFLQSNPNVKYVVPAFDGMAIYAQAGLLSSGALDKVCIVSFNGTPAVLKLIKDGNSGVCADVGVAAARQGWGLADQALRIMAGVPPVPNDDTKATERMFDTSNIDSIDLSAPESSWYGDVDYQAAYKKLWGVQ